MDSKTEIQKNKIREGKQEEKEKHKKSKIIGLQ